MVLICIYVGAIYGGSRSAILLNIPGTPASAASTLDGYPLARQGLAGRAMGISTSGSWLGTLFGILCLAAPHAGPERAGAHVPELRVLLDLGVRRRRRRHARRRRPAQGLHRRLPRAVDRHHRPGALLQLSALRLRLHGSCRRHRPAAGAGRRLRRRRGAAGHARPGRQGRLEQDRLGRAAHRGRAEVLAHDLPLRRHRRVDRHPAGARRGRGGLVLLCRRAARQQGEGEVRQGLDRGPDGRRDRREPPPCPAPSSPC